MLSAFWTIQQSPMIQKKIRKMYISVSNEVHLNWVFLVLVTRCTVESVEAWFTFLKYVHLYRNTGKQSRMLLRKCGYIEVIKYENFGKISPYRQVFPLLIQLYNFFSWRVSSIMVGIVFTKTSFLTCALYICVLTMHFLKFNWFNMYHLIYINSVEYKQGCTKILSTSLFIKRN